MIPSSDATEAYFDAHTPEYDASRFAYVSDWIQRLGATDRSLIDIGCGTGNVLALLREASGLRSLTGLDPSERCLEMARRRIGCETHHGSILDERLVLRLAGQYDFAILGAVLHHLVGNTRAASRSLARRAIRNALTPPYSPFARSPPARA